MTETNKDLLYSRQIAEIGEKTMGQLSELNVLIIGQKSVGFECSKCLALMGIGNIYLYDYEQTAITISGEDIKTTNKNLYGLNFGLNAIVETLVESRKYTISELTAKYLKKLNPFIQVNYNKINQSLNTYIQDINKKLDIIVITDFYNIKLAEFYKKQIDNNQKVILGFTLGYYGIIHSNLSNHIVNDINGEPKRFSFLTNTKIKVGKLSGQLEKNNIFMPGEVLKIISNENRYSGKVLNCNLENIEIEIDDIDKIDLKSVYLEEEKELYKPKFQDWNVIKKDISQWNILSLGKNKYSLEKVLQFINSPLPTSKKKDLTFEDCTLFYELYPIGSIVGGIIAQEVIKLTGKYLPIEQSLFIDGSVLLPSTSISEKSGQFSHIESLIDKEVLNKIKNGRIFMVGAGALGCEHAKNLIMMNGFVGKQGQLTITDPDTISLSNLNRQFLFQNENIGDFKSKVIEFKLNKYFTKSKIKSYTEAVSKETYKTIFKFDSWRTHDIILGALDNHEARLFIDKMAVKFEKPLFESGTQGTKCHTQTIIPNKTITYGEIDDPPQENIPMCTIKNFPNNYTHCIEWALEAFHCIFNQTISDLIEIKKDKNEWISQIQTQNTNTIFDRINKVNIFLNYLNKPTNELISGIISNIYDEFYIEPISMLLNSFPEDLEENGSLFWSGKRKRPTIIRLNEIIESGLMGTEFISGIYSGIIYVLGIEDKEYELYFDEIKEKDYHFAGDFKYTLEELEKNKTKEINSEIIESLINDLKSKDISNLSTMEIKTLEFDKDDDFTLNILDSIAKQRAILYNISVGNSNDTRKIAGRIIPALSTTTTIVSGLVMLEILKYYYNEKPTDFNINLAINNYIGFETTEAPLKYTGMFSKVYNTKVIVIPNNITRWKKIRVSIIDDGVLTMDDLVEHIKCELELENIEMIMIEKDIIYMSGNSDIEKLSILWSKYSIEYNDSIELQLILQNDLPVITAPIYLSH